MNSLIENIIIKLQGASISCHVDNDKIHAVLPMQYLDGNPIEIFIRMQDEETVILSDEGYLDITLRYQYDIAESENRNTYKNFICKTYNLEYDSETSEYFSVVNIKKVLENIWGFAQALHSLFSLVASIKPRVKPNKFKDEVKELFLEQKIDILDYTVHFDYNFSDESDDKLYPCDVVLNGHQTRKPVVIELVSSIDKLAEATQVLAHHLLIKKRKIIGAVIFDNFDELPHKSKNFKRLLNTGAIQFTDIENATDSLSKVLEVYS